MSENKGKSILQIEVDESDVQRLVDAFKTGKLAHLGVVNIDFPKHPEVNPPAEGHASRHLREKKSEPPHR